MASQGGADWEKALKVTRRRKGCIGTCMTERAFDPHSKMRVP
jgi:hypothetical protein